MLYLGLQRGPFTYFVTGMQKALVNRTCVRVPLMIAGKVSYRVASNTSRRAVRGEANCLSNRATTSLPDVFLLLSQTSLGLASLAFSLQGNRNSMATETQTQQPLASTKCAPTSSTHAMEVVATSDSMRRPHLTRKLMLVSDLDDTMVGVCSESDAYTAAFRDFWHHAQASGHPCKLVYNTGR